MNRWTGRGYGEDEVVNDMIGDPAWLFNRLQDVPTHCREIIHHAHRP